MNSTKYLAILSIVTLGLTGCEKLTGSFTVLVPAEFQVRKFLSKKTKPLSFLVGEYGAEAIMNKKKKRIELKMKVDGKMKKILFAAPEETAVPTRNGTLEISAKESGQPYNLFANVDTKIDAGPSLTEYQSCVYDTYEYEDCTDSCETTERGHTFCHETCTTETGYIMGHHWVTYHHETRTTTADVTLSHPNQETASIVGPIGIFNGSNINTYRVTDSTGPCERD